MWLKQSTAKVISFGPFVDKTDGVTPETGLVSSLDHGTTGIMLSKNGAAFAIRHATVTATTYDAYGNYLVTLDTTDTNTLGTLRVQFIETATCLPVWRDFIVVPAMIYDSIIAGSDRLDVNVTHITDQSQTARDIGASVLLSSGTGTGQLDFTSGVVKSNWVQYLGTALGGTAAQVVAAITKFFNVTSPTGTVNSLPDAVPGAAGGVFIAGTNAATTVTTALTTTFTGNLTGSVGSVSGAVGSVTGNVGGNVTGSVGSVAGNVDGSTASVVGAVGSVTGNVGGNVTGSVGSVSGAVGSVTGNVGGNVTGSVGSLATQAKADVNAEVLDVLATDTFAEPSAAPAATSTLKDKLNWIFCLMRNKREQTSTTETLRADNGSTAIATSTKSDDLTTLTRGEWT